MTELSLEHVLILVIVIIILYHFVGRCSCFNGFRVVSDEDNQKDIDFKCMADEAMIEEINDKILKLKNQFELDKKSFEKELETYKKICNDMNTNPAQTKISMCLDASCKLNESNKLTCRQFKEGISHTNDRCGGGDSKETAHRSAWCISKKIKDEYPEIYKDEQTCTGYDTEKLDNVVTLDEYIKNQCCNEE